MDKSRGGRGWRHWVTNALSRWLAVETQPLGPPRNDFARLCEHLQLGDVVLVEGRSRVSGIIQSVTLSAWTHAALYVGRLAELDGLAECNRLRRTGLANDALLVLEAEIGHGVHLSPITRYAREHLRLCRASELSRADTQAVVDYTLTRLGTPYDLRQIVDLLRFFFPYGLLPRRWRSTLFAIGHSEITAAICSTLIARAFTSVRYPILPTMHRNSEGGVIFHHSNTRLITPRDFDYSPYFQVVKYPFFGDDVRRYKELEWGEDSTYSALIQS